MTLTEISYYSRRAAPYAVIAALFVLILYYAFKILFLYIDTQKVTPVASNPIFGQIKAPKVEDAVPPPGQITYTLDTIEGQPVTATDSAKVFFLPKQTTKFGYREKVALLAQNFGINTTAVSPQVDNLTAQYNDGKNTLSVDISSFNFTYQYDLSQDASLFDNIRVPEIGEAEQAASDFLRNLDRYPEDLAQGKVNVVYLHYDPATTQLNVVENSSDANMVEADFYRPDIDGFPLVSPKYFNSQNYVAMVFNATDHKVVKAQVKHFDTSAEQVGLYPVKTGDVAYQSLQSGNAIFINVPKSAGAVSIKKMFLAYLDPEVYQEYLQPVYVFLGDNNFTAYVPAITDEYLIK